MSTIKKQNEYYLTKERLKTTEGFEHLTDDEAQAICDFTKAYAHILFDSYVERTQIEKYESHIKRVPKVRKN